MRLPKTQNSADPAPAQKNIGKQHRQTIAY